jgi:hypothetical protein
MRDIRAGAEVADVTGAENLRRVRHSPAYGPFACWHCDAPGDADAEPATVIAELHEGTVKIALAHAECTRSQVVGPGAPAPAALTEPGTGADMAALTDLLAGPGGPLPLLILDQRPELAVRGGPAEHANLAVSALLSMGLTPVTTIGETPGPAPGWRLELSARRAARLTAPDGSAIYGGECGQPRPWRALITRTNRCAVLIGAIGLYPSPGERAPIRIGTLLDQAAHAEELVGGLVEARC